MCKKRLIEFSPPDITEKEIQSVINVLKSGWITSGSEVKKFEEEIAEYIGLRKCVVLNSWTAVAEVALRILGIGPGDEVITSAYTYTASASIINHVGAKIILVDTAPNSFEMDYQKLEKAITKKTKVIIPVDIAGVICNYKKIYEIINRKKHLFKANNLMQKNIGRITILSDAAHSFGAIKENKLSGLHADITCFSFHAVKNLTTAEGGAVVWNEKFGLSDDNLYAKFKYLSLHGQSKDAFSKLKNSNWEYDIVHLGYKHNLTDIAAAIGRIQLKRYKELLKRRYEIIELYNKYLNKDKISIIKHKGQNFQSSGHLMLCNLKNFTVKERNLFIQKLSEKGISSNVHYKPLPMFTAYKALGFRIENYNNSYKKYSNILSLPLHTLLSNEDVMYICKEINIILKEAEKDV